MSVPNFVFTMDKIDRQGENFHSVFPKIKKIKITIKKKSLRALIFSNAKSGGTFISGYALFYVPPPPKIFLKDHLKIKKRTKFRNAFLN